MVKNTNTNTNTSNNNNNDMEKRPLEHSHSHSQSSIEDLQPPRRKSRFDDEGTTSDSNLVAINKLVYSSSKDEEDELVQSDDESSPEDDDQLLGWVGAYGYGFNEKKSRDVFSVTSKVVCDKAHCHSLLKKIGCENRFIACSMESSHRFYASLYLQEAEKLKGVPGVLNVIAFRRIFCDA